MRYRVEVEGNDEVGYSAYLPELPGCVAAGGTFEETKELIAEAVGLHLELMEAEGLPIPEPAPLSGRGIAASCSRQSPPGARLRQVHRAVGED